VSHTIVRTYNFAAK